MKKIVVSLIAFLGFVILLKSQPVVCGYDIVLEKLEQEGKLKNYSRIFEAAKLRGAESRQARNEEIYTIPVVVHVVWKEEEQNLPDSVILSQIEVLNEDYRRLNPDAGNIRSVFENMVGDPGIEFHLEQIVRVQTDTLFEFDLLSNGLPDYVKKSDFGGSDAYPTDKFLNIWVCHLQPLTVLGIPIGLVLGFAYPPEGLDHWPEDVAAPDGSVDGVVIDYRTFGRNSQFEITMPELEEAIHTQGRTCVHEVGHFLGLRHIWGDALFGDGCEVDDGVTDTPNTSSQSMFDCDTEKNTCDGDEFPDMIENYMDYASEDCMNSFTKGQIDIMRGVLQGPRCHLVGACSPTQTHQAEPGQFSIYPNPVADLLKIDLTGLEKIPDLLIIKNALGRNLLEIEKPAAIMELQVDHFPSGLYYVEIITDAQKLVKPIVVSR